MFILYCDKNRIKKMNINSKYYNLKTIVMLVINFILVGATLFLLAGCWDNSKDKLEKKIISIGVLPDNAPFAFYDADNKIQGLDIDIINRFVSNLGYKPEWEAMRLPYLLKAARKGSIDLGVGGISVSDERKKKISFSDSYYDNNSFALLVRSDSDIKSYEDMGNRKLATTLGSVQEEYAKNNSTKYNKTPVVLGYSILPFVDELIVMPQTTVQQMLFALKTKYVDGILLDINAGILAVSEHPNLRLIKVALPEEFRQKTAVIFPKEEKVKFKINGKTLKELFNEYLEEIKGSGEWDGLIHKWKLD